MERLCQQTQTEDEAAQQLQNSTNVQTLLLVHRYFAFKDPEKSLEILRGRFQWLRAQITSSSENSRIATAFCQHILSNPEPVCPPWNHAILVESGAAPDILALTVCQHLRSVYKGLQPSEWIRAGFGYGSSLFSALKDRGQDIRHSLESICNADEVKLVIRGSCAQRLADLVN